MTIDEDLEQIQIAYPPCFRPRAAARPHTMMVMEAAFFDLDKTVIAKASVAAFGRTLYREGLITRRLLLRVAVGHLIFLQLGAGHRKLEKTRRSMLTIVKGWDSERIEQIVREALEEVLEPIIYAEALDLIKEHQAAGRKVVIISSSPQEIVGPLSEFLGADASIGSRATVDDNGRYTGELEFYAYGPNKALAIEEMAEAEDIDLAASFAYSDSHTDAPMLQCVGHPYAVNPDKELQSIAKANDWPVTWFTHPMPLRDQKSAFRFRIASYLVVGSVALFAGALVSVWRLHKHASTLRSFISNK